MIRRLLFISMFFIAMTATAFSQWTNQGAFPPDTLKANTGGHGVVVDPEGKIWLEPYRPLIKDSVYVADSSRWYNVRPIYVFTPDGKPASFSPIKVVNTAELKNKVLQWSKTGMTKDQNGNILVNDYSELVRINYKTGEGMNWIDLSEAGGSSITKAAVDKDGNIYVSYTLNDLPLIRLNPDFTIDQNVVEKVPEIGRTLDITPDGNTLLVHRFTARKTLRYSRPNAIEGFSFKDSVLIGLAVESSNYNPGNGLLYVSGGSYNGKIPSAAGIMPGVWYGYDNKYEKPLDSLAWSFQTPKSITEEPRGIDFSADGKTAYIIGYGSDTYPFAQKLTANNLPSDVEKSVAAVTDYSLLQNYPNPFNPSTEIKFSVAKAGFVSLKVYDMLGKEVATLMNGNMPKGNYSVRLDGRNLTSGVYIYQLNADGVMLSRKMSLMK